MARPPRRANLTPEELSQMKALDEQGIPRSHIAAKFNCNAASVTQHLGAKRQYKKREVKSEPPVTSE